MGARYLEHAPPSDDYEIAGWRCQYHINFCHNPLDCDFVPLWILKPEARERYWAIDRLRRKALIAAGGCQTCSHPLDPDHSELSYGQWSCTHVYANGSGCSCAGFRRNNVMLRGDRSGYDLP
jgi:hypothetical protein